MARAEDRLDRFDAILQNPAETNQNRQVDAPFLQAIDQFFQVDRRLRITIRDAPADGRRRRR